MEPCSPSPVGIEGAHYAHVVLLAPVGQLLSCFVCSSNAVSSSHCSPLLSSSNMSVVVSPHHQHFLGSAPLNLFLDLSSISSALCPEWGWYTDTRRISPTFAAVVLFVIDFFCPPSSHSFRALPLSRMAECLEWIITVNFATSPIQITPSFLQRRYLRH